VPDEPGVGLEQVRMVPLVESAPAPMSGLPMPPALHDSGPTPASMARGSSASITGRSRGGGRSSTLRRSHAHLLGIAHGNGPNPAHGITVKKVFNPVKESVRASNATGGRRSPPAGGIGFCVDRTGISSEAEGHRPGSRNRHHRAFRRQTLKWLEVDSPDVEFEQTATIIEIDGGAHGHAIPIGKGSFSEYFAEPPLAALARRSSEAKAPHPTVCHRLDHRAGRKPHVIERLPDGSDHPAEKIIFGRCDQPHTVRPQRADRASTLRATNTPDEPKDFRQSYVLRHSTVGIGRHWRCASSNVNSPHPIGPHSRIRRSTICQRSKASQNPSELVEFKRRKQLFEERDHRQVPDLNGDLA